MDDIVLVLSEEGISVARARELELQEDCTVVFSPHHLAYGYRASVFMGCSPRVEHLYLYWAGW